MGSKEEVDVFIDEQLLSKKQRNLIKLASKELCEKIEKDSEIKKKVWPFLSEFGWEMKPILKLCPLDRIGSEPGKSGVKVLAGCFSIEMKGIISRVPSQQLIIKISPDPSDVDQEYVERKFKELKAEFELFKNAKECFDDAHFARPFESYIHEDSKMVVLWAPCSSPHPDHYKLTHEDEDDWKKISDINMYLSVDGKYYFSRERREMLQKIIDAIRHLENAHRFDENGDRTINEAFIPHYEWELRGWEKFKDWTKKWSELWGDEEATSDFGVDSWTNPLFIFNKIKSFSEKPYPSGFVHGDLHPRNIVFTRKKEVKIIDFGWARQSQHIVKDFVLLEANLRCMALPPFMRYDSAIHFLGLISKDDTSITHGNDELAIRLSLISRLRQIAAERMGDDVNWDVQYIIPLFLVSLGLLKHCHSADCTWAVRYNILALARYLKENVFIS